LREQFARNMLLDAEESKNVMECSEIMHALPVIRETTPVRRKRIHLPLIVVHEASRGSFGMHWLYSD